jgi:hypothetical protein
VVKPKALRRGWESGDITFTNLLIIFSVITYSGSLHDLSDLLMYIDTEPGKVVDDMTESVLHTSRAYCLALQQEHEYVSYIEIPIKRDEEEVDNFGCVSRIEVAYITGKYEEALYWGQRGKQQEFAQDWLRNRKLRFYEAMSLAAVYSLRPANEQLSMKRQFSDVLRSTKKWKGAWGHHSSVQLLLMAEGKRLDGIKEQAIRYYEQSVQQAREEQMGLIGAIAVERLSSCLEELGSQVGAAIALVDACMAYALWGATTKVALLKKAYPHYQWHAADPLIEDLMPDQLDELSHRKLDVSLPNILPDTSNREERLLEEIVQWSGSKSDPQLLEHFLSTTMRQAGADRGCVLRVLQDGYAVEAGQGRDFSDGGNGVYAEAILRHVKVTGKAVRLEDAIQSFL